MSKNRPANYDQPITIGMMWELAKNKRERARVLLDSYYATGGDVVMASGLEKEAEEMDRLFSFDSSLPPWWEDDDNH